MPHNTRSKALPLFYSSDNLEKFFRNREWGEPLCDCVEVMVDNLVASYVDEWVEKLVDFEEVVEMAGEERQTMMDYARPPLHGVASSISRPNVAPNNFEIKPQVIQMVQNQVQFGGKPYEDSNAHIASFLEICNTFKINGVSEDAI